MENAGGRGEPADSRSATRGGLVRGMTTRAISGGPGKRDILARSADFSDRCIQVALNLTANGVCWEIQRQLTRCSGGVGANIEEAQAATTKPDFAYRMSNALREARETLFWLGRIRNNKLLKPQRLTGLMQESDELVSILTAIVKNARKTA